MNKILTFKISITTFNGTNNHFSKSKVCDCFVLLEYLKVGPTKNWISLKLYSQLWNAQNCLLPSFFNSYYYYLCSYSCLYLLCFLKIYLLSYRVRYTELFTVFLWNITIFYWACLPNSIQWHYMGTLKSTMAEVLIPWKLTNTTNQAIILGW